MSLIQKTILFLYFQYNKEFPDCDVIDLENDRIEVDKGSFFERKLFCP